MTAEVKAGKPAQKPMDNLGKFLREVRAELKKTAWPTRKELISSTWIVVGFVVATAVFIGVVDLFFAKFMTFVLK